jgi:YesN/AraC family two-component response regulator
MTEKKPYLQEELTLQDLADEISISTHHLSMILNIHLKQNFYNFINSYRVEDVKAKLIQPLYKNQTILSIAYSAGFNSKSTFNTMFKKFTGKTPKEYRSDITIQ